MSTTRWNSGRLDNASLLPRASHPRFSLQSIFLERAIGTGFLAGGGMNEAPRFPTVAGDAELIGKLKALSAYAERVGAKPRNFRRWVATAPGSHGYSRDAGSIVVGADGELTVHGVDPPTEDEAKAIKAEVLAANFPKSIPFRTLSPYLRTIAPDRLFIFKDETGEGIKFVQQRVYDSQGGKNDLPWTYWSDGEWRCMEPDGLLPLFGLEHLKDKYPVVVHEGAKSAYIFGKLMDDKKSTHPWAENLRDACHLGWPGGALRPHGVDWSPLKKLAASDRLILVLDNDQPGKDAATAISRILMQPLEVVNFDDRFPESFDLGDEWPKHSQWWRGERYVGPTMDDLLTPATWATELVPSKAKGRPAYRVRKEFAREWLWAEDPPVFIHRKQSNRLRNSNVFNRAVCAFADVDDVARLLIKSASSRVDGLCYLPHRSDKHSPTVVTIDRKRLVNVFRPPDIKPIKGDADPWIKFGEHLIPDPGDRKSFLRWVATLIACPDVRMRYGVLLISSAQGVGKTTVGEAVLERLVGRWNTSRPNEKQIVDSDFNTWIAHKRLATCNEIYSGQNRKAYDRLKSTITEITVDVNDKFIPVYTCENAVHVFACSNSARALHLDDEDRRFLVPRVTEKQPCGDDEKKNREYWKTFYAWLEGDGLGIIAGWADQFVAEHGAVGTGDHAPWTTAKGEVIAESRSIGQQLAYDLAKTAMEMMNPPKPTSNETPRKPEECVLLVREVREWVANIRKMDMEDHRLEKALTLRKTMKAAGLKDPERDPDKDDARIMIDGRWEHVMANYPIPKLTTWSELQRFKMTPEIVMHRKNKEQKGEHDKDTEAF